MPLNFLILTMFNYSSDPNRIPHPQYPSNTADPQVPLRNLSQVRTRLDSLHRFLSQSINTNTPLTSDQIATVSNHIVSAINQTIANAAALVSLSKNSTAAAVAVTSDPVPPSYPKKPKPEPSAAEKSKQILDSKLEPPEDDDDDVEDFDGEIVELDAVEILAEHMHFCEICGKGFRRDANLRMHMRAHGEQVKTAEALAKPLDAAARRGGVTRFSCPFEGCNRNKQHVRFRPLKSVVCVKNHFKRSHCPKMYTCERCRKKHFSVLSDLRSHVRHCGMSRWKCTCGTTFSRKDKLFSHVALFEGHAPALACDEQEQDDKGKQVVVEDEIEDPMLLMSESELGNSFLNEVLPEGFFDDLGSIHNYCLKEVLGFPPSN